MRRFKARSGESISAVHVPDYTTQDPVMISMQMQSSSVSNSSDDYDTHISYVLVLQKPKGLQPGKSRVGCESCGLRNLEPRLAPRDKQPKRIYIVHTYV